MGIGLAIENLLVLEALKGGPGSGNWGHTSRTRVGVGRGGSDPGGGVATLGLEPGSSAEARRAASQQRRQRKRQEPVGSPFERAISDGHITDDRPLAGGITAGRLVTITGPDGEEYRAIGKPMRAQAAGDFHDGNSEVAAYRVAKVMGIDRVPETDYVRSSEGIGKEWRTRPDDSGGDPVGTAQRFVEGATLFRGGPDTLSEDAREDMVALDIVIYNADRHDQNWVYGPQGKEWAIDHGHAQWVKWSEGNNAPLWHSDAVGYGRSKVPNGQIIFPLEKVRRWSQITRPQWDAAFEGVDQSGNVNADNGWENLQYIIDQGGRIKW